MNKSQGTAPIQWQRIFEVFAYVRNIRSQVSRGIALEELAADYWASIFLQELASTSIFQARNDETIRDCINKATRNTEDHQPTAPFLTCSDTRRAMAYRLQRETLHLLYTGLTSYLTTTASEQEKEAPQRQQESSEDAQCHAHPSPQSPQTLED